MIFSSNTFYFIYLFVFVSKRPTLSKTLYHLVLVHVDLLHSFLFAENISLFFVNLTKTEQEQKNRNLHAHNWPGQGGHGGGHSGTLHALNTMWTWSPNTSSSMSILELSTNLREFHSIHLFSNSLNRFLVDTFNKEKALGRSLLQALWNFAKVHWQL